MSERCPPRLADCVSCTGCGACATACHTGALTLEPDAEGFLRPCVDAAVCVGCGRCTAVCPPLCPNPTRVPRGVWGGRVTDAEALAQSSSGGLFHVLATATLAQGGVVVGCRWAEDFSGVTLALADTPAAAVDFQGAKYVQSAPGTAYEEALAALATGRQVLFTGVPCQVAGFLRLVPPHQRARLLTAEIVCHGTPSPAVWRQALQSLANRFGAPKAIAFRDKRLGWKRGCFVYSGTRKEHAGDLHKEPYVKAFFRALCLRPSCHACVANSGRSGADFTLGDFWCDEELPTVWASDDRGASVVIVWTEAGVNALVALGGHVETVPATWEAATRKNFNLVRATPGNPARAWFMAWYKRLGVAWAERLSKPSRRWIRRLLGGTKEGA